MRGNAGGDGTGSIAVSRDRRAGYEGASLLERSHELDRSELERDSVVRRQPHHRHEHRDGEQQLLGRS